MKIILRWLYDQGRMAGVFNQLWTPVTSSIHLDRESVFLVLFISVCFSVFLGQFFMYFYFCFCVYFNQVYENLWSPLSRVFLCEFCVFICNCENLPWSLLVQAGLIVFEYRSLLFQIKLSYNLAFPKQKITPFPFS